MAKEYYTLMLRGDLLPAYGLLAAADTAVITQAQWLRSPAAALPNATVDSVAMTTRMGDTAVVTIFGRRPNLHGALLGLLGAGAAEALSDTVAARLLASQAASAPLVVYMDTLMLRKAASGSWRVWIATRERGVLDSLYRIVSLSYLDESLVARAAYARRWAERAASFPPVAASGYQRAGVDTLLMIAALTESVEVRVTIAPSYLLRDFRGTVLNRSRRYLARVRVTVWKNGEDSFFEVYGLRPGRSSPIYEDTHLRSGAPDSVWISDIVIGE